MPMPETENMVTTRRLASFASGIWNKITTALSHKANLESPTFTGTPTAPTAGAGTNTDQIATTQFVQTAIGTVAEAMLYKGAVNSDSDLPDGSTTTKKYKAGWTYKVATAGTYAGKVCEVGDLIIANKNYGTGASNSDWDVIQTNIDGAVSGPSSSTDSHIVLFDGVTGKTVKDSGKVLADFATASHTHGNITNDGKIGATSDLAVVTGSAGAVTTANLTTEDPTASGNAAAFIDTISQDSKGKITATKKNIRAASTNQAGIVQLAGSIGATVSSENNKAATEKAVRDALNANGKGVEFIDYGTGTFDDISAIITAGKLPVVRFTVQNQDTIAQYLYAPLVTSGEATPQAYIFTLTTGTQVFTFTRPKTGTWDMGAYDLALITQVVRYDTTQSLTDTQKGRARANIGAGTSDLVIGTTAGTAAEGNHTHATTLATSSGTATVTVTPGSKYQLTAGGTSAIFDIPETSDQEVSDILAALT